MNSKGFSCCFWIIFLHQHSLPTVPGAGNVPPKVSCDVGLRGGKMAHINSAKIFTIHFGKLFTAIVSRHGLYWHKTFLLPLIIWLRQKSWEQKPSLFSPSIIGCAKIEMFAGNGISFHTTSGIQWTPNYHVLHTLWPGVEIIIYPICLRRRAYWQKMVHQVYRRGIVLCVLMNTFYANQQYGSKCWLFRQYRLSRVGE